MHELDGSNAGGQFFRTALTLSAIREEPVRIENVRGDRDTPGLRPQHLAVLECLAEIADADVAGDEVGAETVTFDPGSITGGEYRVEIETAGSVTLLFDALLPLATRLESPLSLTAIGGTDVAWSPPLEYVRRLKLPLLRAFGLGATVDVDRRGFYPEGGGRATLRLWPSRLEPIRLESPREPAALEVVRIYSTESECLADADVAGRQVAGALETLEGTIDERGLEVHEVVETTAASPSPGSAIVLGLEGGRAVGGVNALGEPGKPAERVGREAARAASRFLAHDAPVDRHLADQLLVFLALAGGRLRIPAVTDHVEASLALLEAMDSDVRLETAGAAGGTAGGDEATVTASRPDTSDS